MIFRFLYLWFLVELKLFKKDLCSQPHRIGTPSADFTMLAVNVQVHWQQVCVCEWSKIAAADIIEQCVVWGRTCIR